MGQISKNLPFNPDILRQCREQMGFSLEQVAKTVKAIEQIENGEKRPTYKQLADLADLYEVPDWVFIAPELPAEYCFDTKPSFRKLAESDSTAFQNPKLRKIIKRVEDYRDLLIELRTDLDEPITRFCTPQIDLTQVEKAAQEARVWLGITEPLDFDALRTKLEEQGLFVFVTSKYKDWSKIEDSIRGLCLMHNTMPIIIINDSDAKKAQSFTLMHELGHILCGDTAINKADSKIETWCNQFAGHVLMPTQDLRNDSVTNLRYIKEYAKRFKVSPYAMTVRLRQADKIDQYTYKRLEHEINQEHEALKKQQKQAGGGPQRNRAKEVRTQFGRPFVHAVLASWRSDEITLHKASKFFGIRPRIVLEL